ncbi:MAG: gamma-glutamyl-gamma-aminobutyrate hydrolase family protein [Actinomycetota bacterium]
MSPGRRALFIRHDPDAHPGYVGDRVAERGFENVDLAIATSMADPNPTVDFGDPGEYDLIVPLGSIWSVYDEETIGNWIGAELAFLAEAHRRDIPILGVCFGGQALAAALGGTVSASPTPEVGWRMIESDRPDAIAEGPWMQWHYDRFTVPEGATELARNAIGPQAFILGRSLGLQFHPEVTEAIVHGWLDGAPAEYLAGPEIDPPGVRADATRFAPEARHRTNRIVDWFLDEICGGTLVPPLTTSDRSGTNSNV